MLATLVTALKNYKLQVCDLRMGKDFQRMIVRQWVVQFKVFDQCMSLVCHVHPPAQAIVHSPQHVWHCGNGISYCKWKTIPVVETWECTLDSKLFEVIWMRVGIRQAIHLQFVSEAHTPTHMYTAYTLLSC